MARMANDKAVSSLRVPTKTMAKVLERLERKSVGEGQGGGVGVDEGGERSRKKKTER